MKAAPPNPKRLYRAVGVGAGLILVAILSACSPVIDGKTGITRDSAGHLVGLAKACKGEFDGAGIYLDDPDQEVMAHVATWSRQDPERGLLAWSLEDRTTAAWTTSQPLEPNALKTGNVYVLDAVGDLQKWSADELRFTVEDLKDLTADTVLTAKFDPKTGESRPGPVPRDQFAAAVCEGGAS